MWPIPRNFSLPTAEAPAPLGELLMLHCKMTASDDRGRLNFWPQLSGPPAQQGNRLHKVPMRALVRSLLVSAVLAVVSAAGSASERSPPVPQALDGMRFKGVTGEKGKGADHEDTITFEDGVFRSLDCEAWGFGPAPYTVEESGGSFRFAATLSSPDRGRLEWRGTITGDTAEATFHWRHRRWYWDIDRRYWFKGVRHTGN